MICVRKVYKSWIPIELERKETHVTSTQIKAQNITDTDDKASGSISSHGPCPYRSSFSSPLTPQARGACLWIHSTFWRHSCFGISGALPSTFPFLALVKWLRNWSPVGLKAQEWTSHLNPKQRPWGKWSKMTQPEKSPSPFPPSLLLFFLFSLLSFPFSPLKCHTFSV